MTGLEIYQLLGRMTLLTMISVLMTLSGLVVVRYRRRWKAATDGQGRRMPVHVVAIAVSYYLLLAAVATREADWRAAFYFPALILGIISMNALLKMYGPRPPGK